MNIALSAEELLDQIEIENQNVLREMGLTDFEDKHVKYVLNLMTKASICGYRLGLKVLQSTLDKEELMQKFK